MELDGVGDIEVDVEHLSDSELAQKLQQLGAHIGPVTGMYYVLSILAHFSAFTVSYIGLDYSFFIIFSGC